MGNKVKPRNRYGKPEGFDPCKSVWQYLPDDIAKGNKLNGKAKALLSILIMWQRSRAAELDDNGYFYHSMDSLLSDCADYGLDIDRNTLIRRRAELIAGGHLNYIAGDGKGNPSRYRVRTYRDEDRKYIGEVWRAAKKKKSAQNAVPVEVTKNFGYLSKTVEKPVVEQVTKNFGYLSEEELFDEVVNERKNAELNLMQVPVVERVPEKNGLQINNKINNYVPTELLSYRTPIDKKEKKENEKERKAVPSEPMYVTNSARITNDSFSSLRGSRDFIEFEGKMKDLHSTNAIDDDHVVAVTKDFLKGIELESNQPVNTTASILFFRKAVELAEETERDYTEGTFTKDIEAKVVYRHYAALYEKYLQGTEFDYSDIGISGRIVFDDTTKKQDFQWFKEILFHHLSRRTRFNYLRNGMMVRIRNPKAQPQPIS